MSDCTDKCTQTRDSEFAVENTLHLANLIACSGDPGCIDSENERHTHRVLEIVDAWKKCLIVASWKKCLDKCGGE